MDVFSWAAGIPHANPIVVAYRDVSPRDSMTYEQREAMRILDYYKAGEDIPPDLVQWCLRVTGDAIGLR